MDVNARRVYELFASCICFFVCWCLLLDFFIVVACEDGHLCLKSIPCCTADSSPVGAQCARRGIGADVWSMASDACGFFL